MRTFRKKTAQSTIQYTLVIVLLGMAVVLAGPYVIRAINAHFKGMEDSIYDSFTDPLLPSEDMPPLNSCGDGECCDDDGCLPGREDISDSPYYCCLDCGFCGDNECCGYNQGGNEDVISDPGDPFSDSTYCARDCGRCGDGKCCQECGETEENCCVDCALDMTGSGCGNGYCCTGAGEENYIATSSITVPLAGIGADIGCNDDCGVPTLCVVDEDCDSEAGETMETCPEDCCVCRNDFCDRGPGCYEDLEFVDGVKNKYFCTEDCPQGQCVVKEGVWDYKKCTGWIARCGGDCCPKSKPGAGRCTKGSDGVCLDQIVKINCGDIWDGVRSSRYVVWNDYSSCGCTCVSTNPCEDFSDSVSCEEDGKELGCTWRE